MKKTKDIIYYTYDSAKSSNMLESCREQLRKSGLPIIYMSDSPLKNTEPNLPVKKFIPDWGVGHYASFHGMFKKILLGLELSTADYCFMAEDDVLYDPSHFEFTPPTNDKFYYNENVWHLRDTDGFSVFYTARRLSQMCGERKFLIEHFRKRLAKIESYTGHIPFQTMGFEPGTHNRSERIDDFKSEAWFSKVPSIDIKNGKNATSARWSPEEFRSQKSCRNWKESHDFQIQGWNPDFLKKAVL